MEIFSFNTVAEILCLIVAIFCLKDEHNKVWKFQLLYMALTVSIELWGRYMKIYAGMNNQWLYNLNLIVEFAGVMSIFYILFPPSIRKIFLLSVVVIFIWAFSYDMFTHGFMVYADSCDTTMSVCYCICCLCYYYILLNDDSFKELRQLAPFWWVNGSLFFYFGSIICDLFFYKLATIHNFNPRYYIVSLLNIILYGCYSYAYICRYLHRKSLSL